MKRIEHRSAIALLLAAALALGMGFFVVRLALCGGDWASYSANQHIYQNGVLKSSTLTDRNGVILAQTENGAWRYADDPAVRLSSVHAVGDYRGYISGAISAFADELAGYSFVYGTPGGGTEVALSLDTRLQTAAWDALGGRRGAVLVMNYETGEILTMVSSPSYDPNGEADTSIDGLFINRCTLGTFTPGSVFKLVTLIAAVENLPDLTEQTFTCNQYLDLPGGTVVCTGWHGPQTIEQALANSCNCAFGELSLELGSETIVKTAQRLGVAGSLTLDGAATVSGKIETAEAGSSDEAWLGIGQYTDLVTPYSMLRLCAAIANGGAAVTPTLAYGGVGGGAVLDGKLYTGFNYAGMEAGHMVIHQGGRQCTCGRKGCWEAYASATGLIRSTREAMEAHPDSALWAYAPTPEAVNGKTAFDAAQAGDAAARAVVEGYVADLACGILNLINLFQPETLCVAGGVSKQGENLLGPVRKILDAEEFTRDSARRTRLCLAQLGSEAGVIGAAPLQVKALTRRAQTSPPPPFPPARGAGRAHR